MFLSKSSRNKKLTGCCHERSVVGPGDGARPPRHGVDVDRQRGAIGRGVDDPDVALSLDGVDLGVAALPGERLGDDVGRLALSSTVSPVSGSRTVMTGRSACRTTVSATLPMSRRSMPERPWVPITIRSASTSPAQSPSLSAGTVSRSSERASSSRVSTARLPGSWSASVAESVPRTLRASRRRRGGRVPSLRTGRPGRTPASRRAPSRCSRRSEPECGRTYRRIDPRGKIARRRLPRARSDRSVQLRLVPPAPTTLVRDGYSRQYQAPFSQTSRKFSKTASPSSVWATSGCHWTP